MANPSETYHQAFSLTICANVEEPVSPCNVNGNPTASQNSLNTRKRLNPSSQYGSRASLTDL